MICLKIQKKEKGKLIRRAMSGRVKLKERFNLVLYRCHPHTYKRFAKHNSRHFIEKTVGAITTLVIRAVA